MFVLEMQAQVVSIVAGGRPLTETNAPWQMILFTNFADRTATEASSGRSRTRPPVASSRPSKCARGLSTAGARAGLTRSGVDTLRVAS